MEVYIMNSSSPTTPSLNSIVTYFLVSKSSKFSSSYLNLNNSCYPKRTIHSGRNLSSVTQFARKTVASPRRDPPHYSVTENATEKLPSNLSVTVSHEPNSRVKLTVEVPSDFCDDCHRMVIEAFKQVTGFRSGKERILRATIENILKRTLPDAMSSVSGRALKDTVRIVTNFSEMENSYSTIKTLRYEAIVDLAPKVQWVPDDAYKHLKIMVERDQDVSAHIVSEKEFKRRHNSLGAMKIVTERGLEIGDVVVVDISATKTDDSKGNEESIPSAESKGFKFDTEDGDEVLPGFLDAIIGIKLGETKSFPLNFPDNWKQENLRGVRAQFTVECKELFRRDLPELDDSLADKMLQGCNSLQEVKNLLLQRCLEIEQTALDQATDNAILDRICKVVKMEIPESLFEEQGRLFYGAKLLEIQSNTKVTKEQLESLSSAKAVNEFLQGQRENIMNVIKQNIAVGDIFRRENLEVPVDEIAKEVENSIAEFRRQKQGYDVARIKEQVTEVLEGAKVLEWLRANADISYTFPENQ